MRWLTLYAILTNIILSTLCSCSETVTHPSSEEITVQSIHYLMQPVPPAGGGWLHGESVATYIKVLNAGANVSGYVELNGEWELIGDWRTPWFFKALDPGGVVLDAITVDYDMNPGWITSYCYYFNFTASTQGVYTIQVIHVSVYAQDLHIEIQPSGWERSGNQ